MSLISVQPEAAATPTPSVFTTMPLMTSYAAAAMVACILVAPQGVLAQQAPNYVATAAATTDLPSTAGESCPDWRQCGMGKSMKCCRADQECWNNWFDYSCHNKTESDMTVGKYALSALQGLFDGKSADAAEEQPSERYSDRISDFRDTLLRGSTTCSRCLHHNCCSNGLRCRADGHGGACTRCTDPGQVPCGPERCCNGGEECQADPKYGYGCTLP